MFDIHGIATSRADDEHCGGSIVPHLIVPHPTLSVATLGGITAAAFIRNSSLDEGMPACISKQATPEALCVCGR